jgi:hypothetical protein
MLGEWAGVVTLILFGVALLSVLVLGFIMTKVLHRYPDAYRQAFWRGELFTVNFLRASTTPSEFVILLTSFAIVALLFVWVLLAAAAGWLRPTTGGG